MKKQSGITLIALIITIIVLLILAVVSIRLVMNSGIITKSEQAVDTYSEEEIKEKIQLAYADYQMAKASNESYTFEQALQKAGIAYKSVTGSDAEGYVVTVETKDGEKSYTVSATGVGKVKTLEDYGVKVGDYISYDCYTGVDSSKLSYPSPQSKNGSSNQTFTVTEKDKNMAWRVLGIENGRLILVAADTIDKTLTLTTEMIYPNGADELEKIGAIYGHGEHASKGRSITQSDIYKIENYNTTYSDYMKTWEFTKTVSGVSYKKPQGNTGTVQYSSNTFRYYDEKDRQWKNLTENDDPVPVTITKKGNPSITNELIRYKAGTTTNADYWIGDSQYIDCSTFGADFGMTYIASYGGIYEIYLNSNNSNSTNGNTHGVRPVVILNSNVQIDTSDSTKDGSSVAKAYELKAQ